MVIIRKIIFLFFALLLMLNVSPSVEFENGFSIELTGLLEAKAEESGYGFYQSYIIVTTVFTDIDFGEVQCIYEWEEEVFGFDCDSSNMNECNPGEPSVTLIPVDSFCTGLPEILPGG